MSYGKMRITMRRRAELSPTQPSFPIDPTDPRQPRVIIRRQLICNRIRPRDNSLDQLYVVPYLIMLYLHDGEWLHRHSSTRHQYGSGFSHLFVTEHKLNAADEPTQAIAKSSPRHFSEACRAIPLRLEQPCQTRYRPLLGRRKKFASRASKANTSQSRWGFQCKL